MKNARIFLLATLFLALKTLAHGQTYRTAAGIRVDNGMGFTVQRLVANKWTVEGILHAPLRSDDLGVSVLGERHHKILVRNLNFYYGLGGHYYWKSDASGNSELETKNVFGLSGIGGLELSLGRINISADFKPELHLSGDQVHPAEWTGASISVRYIFEKRRKNVREWVNDRMPKKKRK